MPSWVRQYQCEVKPPSLVQPPPHRLVAVAHALLGLVYFALCLLLLATSIYSYMLVMQYSMEK
jgi:hypothetical protein